MFFIIVTAVQRLLAVFTPQAIVASELALRSSALPPLDLVHVVGL